MLWNVKIFSILREEIENGQLIGNHMSEISDQKETDRTKVNLTDEIVIHISDMNKWFGNFQVLKDVNLEVEKNKK